MINVDSSRFCSGRDSALCTLPTELDLYLEEQKKTVMWVKSVCSRCRADVLPCVCEMRAWKNGSDITDQWSGSLLRTSARRSHSQRSGHTPRPARSDVSPCLVWRGKLAGCNRMSRADATSLRNLRQADMRVIRSHQWHLTWAYRPRRWPGAPAAARRTHTPPVSHSDSWRGFRNPRAPTWSPSASSTPSPKGTVIYTACKLS